MRDLQSGKCNPHAGGIRIKTQMLIKDGVIGETDACGKCMRVWTQKIKLTGA